MRDPLHIVIPARLESTRLRGKVLADVWGKPLIQWVYERASLVPGAQVRVATDAAEVAEAVRGFGGLVSLTRADHVSGTSRVAEVVAQLVASGAASPTDLVLNLQGDEPLIAPEALAALSGALRDRREPMATLACPLTCEADWLSPHVVKVLVSSSGRALYFSRSPLPTRRQGDGQIEGLCRGLELPIFSQGGVLRHIGVYGFRAGALLAAAALSPGPLERAEDLEQLRWLWHDLQMAVVQVDAHGPGVDTPSDLVAVREALKGAAGGRYAPG